MIYFHPNLFIFTVSNQIFSEFQTFDPDDGGVVEGETRDSGNQLRRENTGSKTNRNTYRKYFKIKYRQDVTTNMRRFGMTFLLHQSISDYFLGLKNYPKGPDQVCIADM